MWEYANGIDNSEVVYVEELPKCVGNPVTLPSDINNEEKLEEVLLALAEHQLSLFENKCDEKQRKLDKTIDSLNEKYGNNSITRAGKMNIEKIVKLKE